MKSLFPLKLYILCHQKLELKISLNILIKFLKMLFYFMLVTKNSYEANPMEIR